MKNLLANAGATGDKGLIHGLGGSPGEGNGCRLHSTPGYPFLPGELRGQRSLAGYSPRGHNASDMAGGLTVSLPFVFLRTDGPRYLTCHCQKSDDLG